MDIAQQSSREVQLQTRTLIQEIQRVMLEHATQTVPEVCVVQHTFSPGCYTRTMFIPKGTRIVGKIHRHAHTNIISVGAVQVLTEWGVQEYEGFCIFVSEPGTKRVVHAVQDTVWSTVHLTNETDLAIIERDIIAEDYTDLQEAPT